MVLPESQLLYALNGYLGRSAVMIQPLRLPDSGGEEAQQDRGGGGNSSEGLGPFATIDIALPLPAAAALAGAAPHAAVAAGGDDWDAFASLARPGDPGEPSSAAPLEVQGILPSGEAEAVALPPAWAGMLRLLGLGSSLGHLRLLRDPGSGAWVPLQLCLGMPLQPPELCQAVCDAAAAAGFLDPHARRAQQEGQAVLQRQLLALVAEHGACSNNFVGGGEDDDLSDFVDRPVRCLKYDGGQLAAASFGPYLQGPLL